MMDPTTEDGRSKRGFRLEPWPTAIVLFFVVVFVVNAIFVRLSLNSWSGLVTDKAYDKGLAYNKVLKAQQEQEAMGWRVTLDDDALKVGSEAPLRLTVLDQQGSPLVGANVEGTLVRPVQQGYDREFVMKEISPGRYEVGLMVPLSGIWELKVRVSGTGGEYRLARRIQVSASGLGG
ncbi:MAG: FixH family protein [Magnetococcales bacterium]|nr:FixH family protein [Magnetococcales bacterium]